MRSSSVVLILAALSLTVAAASAGSVFHEQFDDEYTSRWTQSKAAAEAERGAFVHTSGKWYADEAKKGIQTGEDARFYQYSAPITDGPFTNEDKDLVIQYTVKMEETVDCGGAYIKVLRDGYDPEAFNGDTDYAVMFGPDICGTTRRIHLIFNYKGENLLWNKKPQPETDKLTHVYTVIVHPDNTYKVLVDNEERESGNLLEDWDFLAPKEIKDPEVTKPDDWVDEPMMDDPEDVKPDDWDVPAMIEDAEAEKPEDWDDEDDGEWERPLVGNPDYKGEWYPKRVENPAYKGPWEEHHPMVPNPDYEADDKVYLQRDMGGVGIELWQVKSGSLFDNIYVGDDVEEAAQIADTLISELAAEKEMFDELEKERLEAEAAEREAAEAAAAAENDGDAFDSDAVFASDFEDAAADAAEAEAEAEDEL